MRLSGLVLLAMCLPVLPAVAASPAPAAAPLPHAHAFWSDAPWDGPAIQIILSDRSDMKGFGYPPPPPPWLRFDFRMPENELRAVPLDLKPGAKVGYTPVIAVHGDPRVKEDSWTIRLTAFDPDGTIEGSYDVVSAAGTHIRGTFSAKGPGGHWRDGRVRGRR